jgi:hypothetical protein
MTPNNLQLIDSKGDRDPHPPAFIISVLLVVAVCLVAPCAPSRRARRIDPAALPRSI